MNSSLLIVDDEKNTREGLRLALEDEFDVFTAPGVTEALHVLKNEEVDAVVTDLRLGGPESGMDVLRAALKLKQPPVCILMTAYGAVDVAVEAMKEGAWHFVTKPVNIQELELLIKRGIKSHKVEKENVELRRQVDEQNSFDQIIGTSELMRRVFQTIRQVAPTEATVLIEGESGTGKELAARAVHSHSLRAGKPLVITHCAALPANLLESELFGHEKGAFTGATERRTGRFEQASNGTLFLDEIGEIDAATQVKLLRAIGEQTVERVGSSKPIKVNIRLVAATNKNLVKLVEEGVFREDLFYRLNVVRVRMPALRERKEDILPLARHFVTTLSEKNNKPVRELSPDAIKLLEQHDWPGNVRELRTAIEHGVVMGSGTRILPHHLPEWLIGGPLPRPDRMPMEIAPIPISGESLNLDQMEKKMIQEALRRTGDNKTEAAKLLGISRRTLHRKWADLM